MPLLRRQFIGLASGALAAPFIPRSAWSQLQSYPNKVIKIVVPFPAGGPTDLVARLAGQCLSSALGQNAIIENVAGAGGTIGSQAVARANADGYTLLLGGTNSNAITAAFYKNLSYDPIKDFAPIAAVGVDSSVLVVTPTVPANTIQEFIQYLRSNPGKLTCGAPVGISPHAMVAFFMVRSGTKMVFVPYRGGAPLITDLLGGQVQMSIGAKATLLPHVQAGKLRALAVTSDGRWPELPDVPTMRESGFPELTAYQWFMLLAPAKTPADVIDKLNVAINTGLQAPDLRASLIKLGVETKIHTPQELQKIVLAEAQQWHAIVTSAGIKID